MQLNYFCRFHYQIALKIILRFKNRLLQHVYYAFLYKISSFREFICNSFCGRFKNVSGSVSNFFLLTREKNKNIIIKRQKIINKPHRLNLFSNGIYTVSLSGDDSQTLFKDNHPILKVYYKILCYLLPPLPSNNVRLFLHEVGGGGRQFYTTETNLSYLFSVL